VKKLIWRKGSSKFATADGGWTHDLTKAKEFADPLIPSEIKTQYPYGDLELYYSFGDSGPTEHDFRRAVFLVSCPRTPEQTYMSREDSEFAKKE